MTLVSQVLFLVDNVMSAVALADPVIGAPSGPMYAALMGLMTLEQYESLMGKLVEMDLLRKSHDCYFLTTKGKEAAERLEQVTRRLIQ